MDLPLPFSYESTGIETLFVDLRDPDYRSRRVFHFHRPETLREWLSQPDTLCGRLHEMPEQYPLISQGLWDAQIEAITSLEQSFAQNKSRTLIQIIHGNGESKDKRAHLGAGHRVFSVRTLYNICDTDATADRIYNTGVTPCPQPKPKPEKN